MTTPKRMTTPKGTPAFSCFKPLGTPAFGCLVLLTVLLPGLAGEPAGKRPPLPSKAELATLPPDGGPKWNRLVFESSPYLLQHAANPVDWRPWGEEAFKAAREQNKPIFLSIGYATCHWCHVMEHESFEDAEVAALLNQSFICIKVDREERPDVDDVYMTVCQAMTGGGGWPLNAVLTPDLKPFFVGTYFPKTGRFGRPGMLDLVPKLASLWRDQRDDVIQSADKLTAGLRDLGPQPSDHSLDKAVLEQAAKALMTDLDTAHGGFGKAPKFLTPHRYRLLLRQALRNGDSRMVSAVVNSLDKMRAGGIYDQVGYGFHRYATDAEWLVPHFEKMLYDQALMVPLLLEAQLASGHERFGETAREILSYLERRMSAPSGGFYSAEDADSEGEEGRFYLWTPEELERVLGKDTAELWRHIYGVATGGNYRDEASGEKNGGSILHRDRDLVSWSRELKREPSQLKQQLETARLKLLSHREQRPHPFRDDKILTDWNGLAVSAFARAGAVLNEPRYVARARQTADYLLGELRDGDGRLFKRARQGEAGLTAHLDDYAFVIAGLLDLYEAGFELKYLNAALALTEITLRDFLDKTAGGFFLTGDHAEKLILRSKTAYDGALPSGNSVMALNLVRLGRITANESYETEVDRLFKAFAEQVRQQPAAFSALLAAVDFAVGPSFEIVLAGKADAPDMAVMARRLHQAWLPNRVILFRADENPKPLAALAPYTEGQVSREGRATAYVCQNFACLKPTTDPNEMAKNLKPKGMTR